MEIELTKEGHIQEAIKRKRQRKKEKKDDDECYRIEEFMAEARKLMNSHGLQEWIVTHDRAVLRAGICMFEQNTLSFSEHLILHDGIVWDQKINVVLHEIAHALVGYTAGHGEVWKNKFLEIGGNGKVYYDSVLKKPNALLKCPCGLTTVDVYRVSKRMRDGKMKCKYCSNALAIF